MVILRHRLLLNCCLTFVILFASTAADESRAVVEDTVSGQQHEAIEPEPDSHENSEDSVLVLPVSYHHGISAILKDKPPDKKGGFKMASLKMEYVGTPFLIALWVFIAGLTKIGFHVTPKISLICPESCLLIVVGVIIGLLLFYAGLTNVGPLTPNVFFLYMLPPIVLDAGYFMPNRPFFDNLATILMFAVLGTVFNAMSVGISLWAVGLTGLYGVEMPLLDTLLFSSIACAVDPIAVLAVFEEIHVNEVLYILVFGESLLNDAVTVVLYHMFEGYAEMGPTNIIPVDYLAGVASFFVVAVGGTLVGILWGLLAAFVSRFTHHVLVIEPLFVFVMSYLSYVSAELFHFSGILALTFCGITMKNYVEENISYKSHVTVKYAMKMLASSSETIIFLFLGVSTVNDNHEWNTWFVVCTIAFCTVYRTIGVVILTSIANRFRVHQINGVEQFILAYGGLRGAVAFALVLIVSDRIIPTKNMMVTTIIALVFFTVFIQGMTIGPLVRILNVPTRNKMKPSMNERIITRSMDYLMAAIEDIVGQTIGNYHLRDKFKHYNNKYLRPVLTREHLNAEPKIFETYSKLNVADAMTLAKQNSTLLPGGAGNDLGVSLSSLFRSYTQANLGKSPSEEKNVAEKAFERNDSSFLNVDIAELGYSPSYKDLADAELHHILSDAMFKPTRKRYLSHRMYERDHAEDSRTRLQQRHRLDERVPHRRLSCQHRCSDKSVGSTSSDGRGLISGRRKSGNPPPKLRFSDADDPSSEYATPQPMPTQTGAAAEEPLSAYSSLLDVSSAPEDEGIVFTAHMQRTPSPRTQESDSDNDDSSLHISSPKTLTETMLPWKRDVGETPETEDYVQRQHDFPPWVTNRDYHIHGSPSNTLISRLDNKRVSAPAVFDLFDDSSPEETIRRCSTADDLESRLKLSSADSKKASTASSVDKPKIKTGVDKPWTKKLATNESTAIDMGQLMPRDVVIEIKINGKSPEKGLVNGELSDDDVESQATRL